MTVDVSLEGFIKHVVPGMIVTTFSSLIHIRYVENALIVSSETCKEV